jgi:NADH dehydrogenase/NADH:ubiquinone oxidoreductase subunit G
MVLRALSEEVGKPLPYDNLEQVKKKKSKKIILIKKIKSIYNKK